jgi:meso-butanediol dehydrogenase/(S,S)-butanediol dehydrogenase/diacetyl reductase
VLLEGKTAVITGAARGIGRAVARRFVEEGAAVVVADIDERKGEQTVDALRADGARATFVATDVSDTAAINGLISAALREHGSVDVLHNNAYVLGQGRAHELSVEDWQRTIDVCLTSCWYATKVALVPMMEQGGGSIINTASLSGLKADYTLTAYSAAKAGVVNLTRVVGIEYARKGIRCNAICPGPIWHHGDEALAQLPDDVRDGMLSAVPMGRPGRAEEVADLALFLASDESSFMTGAAVTIDGGLSAQTGMPSLTGQGADW